MTFLLPLGYEGNPGVSCTQPTRLGSVLRRAAALAIDSAPVYDHRSRWIYHPNNWDDIDQWFQKNLTYETDEMFQAYIQGHLWLTPRCRDSPDGTNEPYGLGRPAGQSRWYAERLGDGRPA